jgi:hypothetical protein
MEVSQFSCQKKKIKMKSPEKVMATIFWDMHRVLLVDFIPCGAMISAGYYQGTPTGLKEAVHCKRPGLLSQGVLLLHDNVRPHTAYTTANLLNFGLGTFFLVLPIVLIWHCWTSTC